jgi:hypothetical protein
MVIYGKAFFDLQLRFAHRVVALSGLPLARALLEYTNLYIRFGLGRDIDATHPAWQEYLAGLRDTNDESEWTYGFYRRRPEATTTPAVVATFGCFSYARSSGERIRLHFQNVESDGHSPLAIERRGQRREELAALFEHVQRTGRFNQPSGPDQPLQVAGASWLYNLPAYRRLFPGSYLATARVMRGRFQRMPLWGQFLDRRGEIKEGMARQFLDRLGRQASLAGLDQCFPLQVLSVAAPVLEFYDFYGISGPGPVRRT